MKCKKCGYDNMDGANFCINCGERLEEENETQSVEANSEAQPEVLDAEVTEVTEVSEAAGQPAQEEANHSGSGNEPEEELWFYVEGDGSVGPFTPEQMKEKVANGTLNAHSYVWSKGLPDWIRLSQSPFYVKEEPAKEAPSFDSQTSSDETAQWFTVQDNRSTGPYTPEVIAQMLANGTINGATYVWKEGMPDWDSLRNTELAKYLTNETPYQQQSYTAPNYQSRNGYPIAGLVNERSIILYIILVICTCGIWQWVWIYQIAKDVNNLAEAQNRPKGIDPVLAVILSLFSCNVFTVYYLYKEEAVLASLYYPNYKIDNQGIMLAILGIFLPTASLAIMQDQINSIVKYGR